MSTGRSSSPTRSSRKKNRDRLADRRGRLRRNQPFQIKRVGAQLDRDMLINRLPGRIVGQLTHGKTTQDIWSVESPHADRGFDAISWRDEDGTKMFLRNRDRGDAIQPDAKVTFQNVLELALRSRQAFQNQPVPDTIVVQTNDTDGSRLAAQQMVLNILDEAAEGDPKKTYILKEVRADPLNPRPDGGSDFAITYRILPKTEPDRIPKSADFIREMGEDPKEDKKVKIGSKIDVTVRERGKRYRKIVESLDALNARIEAVDGEVFDVEDSANRPPEAARKLAELNKLADAVIARAQDYIENSGTVPLSRERKGKKKSKAEIVDSLRLQITASKQNGFKDELDALRQTRIAALNPLNEGQIIPGTREVLGSGAHGDIVAATIQPANGPPFRAAIKGDSKAWEANSKAAGIPAENPRQAARSVAVSRINDAFGLDSIPRTEFIQLTDSNGRPQLGQAIGVVNGAVGQKKVQANNIPVPEEDALFIPGAHIQIGDTWYVADTPQANVDHTLGIVQKGLTDLQILDVIIGHVDRNAGNYIFETDPLNPGVITGVKGIDNDDTLASKWEPEGPGRFEKLTKTPGVPPVVDVETALKILTTNDHHLREILSGFTDEEINAARDRFLQVQAEISQRVRDGKIASHKPRAQLGNEITRLAALSNAGPAANVQMLTWGGATAGEHTPDNSYVGKFSRDKNDFGTYPGPAINQGIY